MNTAILKSAAEHGGPIALSAGVAALTVALVSAGHDRVTAAPRSGPTVTATVTAPEPEPARTRVVARPRTSRPDTGVTAAAAREPRTQAVTDAEQRPGPGIPSGPSPAPPQRPSTSCTGIAAVQLLHRCAFTIGGSR